jgi:hypothetical protein
MESFSTFSPEHADLFGRERAARLAQGAHLTPQAESDRLACEADAQSIKDAGIFIKPGFFDPQRLSALGARIDGMIANRENLGRLRNHRLEFEQGRKLGDFLYLDPATVTSEDDIARHCANVNIRDPLVTLPEIIDLVLDPRVLGTASAYLGCVPVPLATLSAEGVRQRPAGRRCPVLPPRHRQLLDLQIVHLSE